MLPAMLQSHACSVWVIMSPEKFHDSHQGFPYCL